MNIKQKRIAFINPYFGQLPETLDIWLLSCKYNPTIDWFIFTDDRKEINVPPNVKIIFMEFSAIKERMQKLFPFDISLETSYKLCDYKPCYGLAFEDYLKEYDFWGHCDMDLIFGDLRKYLTEDILEGHDRIGMQGQCSIYRNTERMNTAFKNMPRMGCIDWHDVYSKPQNFAYDEWAEHNGGGLSEIMKRNNIRYCELHYADIMTDKYGIYSYARGRVKLLLHFNKGRLTENFINCESKQLSVNEIQYAHFQKRKMVNRLSTFDSEFIVVQPGIYVACSYENISLEELEKYNVKHLEFPYKIKYNVQRIKRKICKKK